MGNSKGKVALAQEGNPERQRSRALANAEFSETELFPADEVEKYERIHPGAAKILLDEIVSELQHSRAVELESFKFYKTTVSRGQWMAFVIGLASILGGVLVAVIANQPIPSAIITIMGVGSIIAGLFVNKRK